MCLAIVAEDGRHEFGALRMVKILAEEKLSWCSLDSTCGGDWMRVRVSFLVVMLAIGCVGMLGQSNATTSGGGQVPDAANRGCCRLMQFRPVRRRSSATRSCCNARTRSRVVAGVRTGTVRLKRPYVLDAPMRYRSRCNGDSAAA